MARLAIFIDGGYVDSLGRDEFSVWVDYQRFVREIADIVAQRTSESVDILRTYYYHCLPYQSNPPTDEERHRYSQRHRVFTALRRLDRFIVREGRLAYRGQDAQGQPIFSKNA